MMTSITHIPLNLKIIAKISSDYRSKFGIPRQPNLAPSTHATIIFEPDFRNDDALIGLDAFSHIWILWCFSETIRSNWSPTVRPPKLGGNKRMGVFATRSPFRPNPIAISAVKLLEIEKTKTHGSVIHVAGADLMHNTPILDIKPYLSFADSWPHAQNGFADTNSPDLTVIIPDTLATLLPTEKEIALREILAQDPRPGYQNDPNRTYGFHFANWEIKYTVKNTILTVTNIVLLEEL